MKPRLTASGDQCLIVEFGETIDLDVNAQALAFARRVARAALPGVVDIVPSHVGVGIHYRVEAVDTRAGEIPFDALARALGGLLRGKADEIAEASRLIDIPVCYGGRHGEDLDTTAATLGFGVDAMVALLAVTELRVLMIGFAPGQPYLGMLDPRLSIPRRSTPRTRVPAGSVATANGQVTVYPFELPGGWHLLGRTPLALFNRTRSDDPCLLRPGDRVRFVPIEEAAFDATCAAMEPDTSGGRN